MTYFLVGKRNAGVLNPGDATLIKKCDAASGPKWAYLYIEDSKGFPCCQWGRWQDHEYARLDSYPSAQEIESKHAFSLIMEYCDRKGVHLRNDLSRRTK